MTKYVRGFSAEEETREAIRRRKQNFKGAVYLLGYDYKNIVLHEEKINSKLMA
jgi:hypothetical protein